MPRRSARHFVYATPGAVLPFKLGCGRSVFQAPDTTNCFRDDARRLYWATDETRHEAVTCERCRQSPMFKDMVHSITEWPIAHKAKYGKERTP